MFPRHMTLLEIRVVDMSLQACSNVTLADVGECTPPGHDSSLNFLDLVFVYSVVSLSHVDVAFNVLDLNVVDILYRCIVFNHNFFSSPCSSLYPDFHFHVAFVIVHVVY